jgi:hypothetical protein
MTMNDKCEKCGEVRAAHGDPAIDHAFTMTATAKSLHVKKIGTDEVVHSVEVKGSNHEKVMRGMMINMDADRFYVDDSEFDE